jgi:hypothetical protein
MTGLAADYFNQVAQKKISTLWTFYTGLDKPTPLVLTKGAPPISFRVKVTASAVDTHTDCAGTVTVNSETLTFTGAGTKSTTTTLTSLPTITTANLDCWLVIWAIDTSGTDYYEVTWTDFDCRWEDAQIAYYTPAGAWAQSNAIVYSKTAYVVGNTLRKYGTTTEITIKKVMIGTDLDGIEEYRKYIL